MKTSSSSPAATTASSSVFLITLMMAMLLALVEVNSLSFTCFLEKSSKSCYQNGGMYCQWSPSKEECELSPFSLTLLCKYDKVEEMCVIAKQHCADIAEQGQCSLQGVCEWKSDKCAGKQGDVTLEELLEMQVPPSGGDDDGGSRPPSKDDQCCEAALKLCTEAGQPLPRGAIKGFRKLMRRAARVCGVRGHKQLCAKTVDKC